MTQPLHDWKSAVAILRVSESWLRKQVAARQVPHTRLGRNVRFTDDDLAAIAAQGHVEPSTSGVARKIQKRAKVA